MPIYDAKKIMRPTAAQYEELSELCRFEVRVRQQALEMVECSGQAIETIAASLVLIAEDVRNSVVK